MDLREAMRSTPASRHFLPDPVDPEVLREVLDDARFAPSGGNRQGWRVIAVTDAETRRTLRDLYQAPWRAYMERTGGAQVLSHPEKFDPALVRRVQGSDEYAEGLDRIPLHLLVWVATEDLTITDLELDRPSIIGGASIYPFVQNVLLGLRAAGLGASLTTLLVPAEAQVRELLGVPEGMALAAYIGVGHRARPWPKQLSRRPVDAFAFGERWGQAL